MKIKINNWVLCPKTKDDLDNPTIVAKVVMVEKDIITIQLNSGTVTMPRSYCRKVFVQGIDYKSKTNLADQLIAKEIMNTEESDSSVGDFNFRKDLLH